MARCRYEGCNREAYKNFTSCILHIDFPAENEQDFDVIKRDKCEEAQDLIDSGELNFRGAKVYEINASDRKNITKLDFYFATVAGGVSFQRAEISDNAFFGRATIEQGVRFDGAQIKGSVQFDEARMNDVVFEGTQVYGDALFEKATIRQNAKFDNVTITENASFRGARVDGDALFAGAHLCGQTSFIGSDVGGHLTLDNAEICGEASFDVASVSGIVSFEGARFKHHAAKEAAFRAAKQNCEQRGDRKRADDNFYKEMVARRRKRQEKWYYRYLERFFVDWILKYGTSPRRVFCSWLTAAAIIAGLALWASWYFSGNWHFENFFFGFAATFAPGLGLSQTQFGLQLLPIIEAVVSAFFWAAFIVVFARKYMR